MYTHHHCRVRQCLHRRRYLHQRPNEFQSFRRRARLFHHSSGQLARKVQASLEYSNTYVHFGGPFASEIAASPVVSERSDKTLRIRRTR